MHPDDARRMLTARWFHPGWWPLPSGVFDPPMFGPRRQTLGARIVGLAAWFGWRR